MNFWEFVSDLKDGTYDVQWDAKGNLDIIPMELLTGYMVSLPDSELRVITNLVRVAAGEIWDWMNRPENRMSLETFYLGVWTDNGMTYFDISVHYAGDRTNAEILGRHYNQLAIWDNWNKAVIVL